MQSNLDRAVMLGQYIAETNATVRQCAKEFGVSKSTVHEDVTRRLGSIDKDLYLSVRCVLEKNKLERHLRGGEATKRKYIAQKENTTRR